jgi:hypothetical protein
MFLRSSTAMVICLAALSIAVFMALKLELPLCVRHVSLKVLDVDLFTLRPRGDTILDSATLYVASKGNWAPSSYTLHKIT